MPVFQIQHITKYQYDFPVRESSNQIRIFPLADARQEVLNHQVTLNYHDANIATYKDYFDNTVGVFTITEAHQELVIDSRLTVRTHQPAIMPGIGTMEDWDKIKVARSNDIPLLDFSKPEIITGEYNDIEQFIQDNELSRATPFEVIEKSAAFVFQEFKYIKGITDAETTLEEALELRSGVCQDFAHVLLQILRTAGIPARYVSGYICPNQNGMRGEGATHAWVEAWLPDSGWTGIDPTNNVWVTDTHVRLGVGRTFKDCTPMKGTFKGPANQSLSVYVSIGYEDGHISKEHNEVQPGSVTSKPVPVVVMNALEQVQQQQ